MPLTPVEVDPLLLRLLMGPWAALAALVFGLCWGSFACVVIWRLPRGESVVRPRSRCADCAAPIAWYDNIPLVSYVVLRGRCRACGARFSARHLVVELAGGVLSLTLYTKVVLGPLLAGGGVHLLAWLLLFAFAMALVIVAYTDLDFWIIPDAVVLPLVGVGLLCAVVDAELLGVMPVDAGVAAAAGYGLIYGLRWIYLKRRGIEALGLGDGKLLAMVGAFCGGAGLSWTIAAGAVQGLVIAVPLVLLGRRVAHRELAEVHGDDPELGEEDPAAGIMGARVPFGPFLALAALEFVLLREPILGLLGALAP